MPTEETASEIRLDDTPAPDAPQPAAAEQRVEPPPAEAPQAAPGPEPAASAPAQPDWASKYAALEAKHTEVADAYLRAKAESENTRRRADDEVAKARKFAVESFAESLLPVRDSLETALALPAATTEQLREGVEATLRLLASALERNKVVAIEPAAGERFDPHRHQAISVVALPPESTQDANTVVTVLQKGYLIADRVLRPALVTVAAAK